MAVRSLILGPNGKPYQRPAEPRHPVPRNAFDLAQTTKDNQNHWSWADDLSARMANSAGVRRILRARSRYEAANSPHYVGLARRYPDNVVGKGPILQVTTDSADTNSRIEATWQEWSEAICLQEKLWTMVRAKLVDGETFGLFFTNDRLPTSVQLDIKVLECDQVADLWGRQFMEAGHVEAIKFDHHGNPLAYHILDEHPGDFTWMGLKGRWYPARQVIHWFRKERPGQARGIPEMISSLPGMAINRRWRLATLSAAEIAAEYAVLLKTQAPPSVDDFVPLPDGDSQEIERNMMAALPDGYDALQLKPEHPATTHAEFNRENLKEMGSPISAPYNVSGNDSSPYNFSSARMDNGNFRLGVGVERFGCEKVAVNRIFAAFLDEAVMIPGLLPDSLASIADVPHTWNWPGWEEIQPLDEARADTERLNNGTTTLAKIAAKRGEDWESDMRQKAKENALAAELGLPLPHADANPVVPAKTKPDRATQNMIRVEVQDAVQAALQETCQ